MANNGSAAILAKAHALFGKRISDEDYRQMARMHSFREVVTFLKSSTYFSSDLEEIQENFVQRIQVELLLQKAIYNRESQLKRYTSKKKENSVYQFSKWYTEITIVLLAVRQVNLKDMQTYTSLLPSYALDKLSFDPMNLVQAKDQDELCRLLDKTIYGKLIRSEQKHADGRFRVSRCETVLYQFYYDRIFEVIQKQYSGKDRRDLNDLYQKEVEFLNTNMIYRFKRYFGGDPTEIRARLIRKHDKRNPEILEKMITTSSSSEVLKLSGEYSGGLTGEDITKRSIWRDQQRFSLYKKHFYKTTNPDIAYICYTKLSQMEVIKITRLLEGVHYMEDPVLIEAMAIYA